MKKLVLYGAGEMGREWLKRIGSNKVYKFADSNPAKVGQEIEGIECWGIEELIKRKDEITIFLSVAEKYINEVTRYLETYHLTEFICNSPYTDDIVRVCEGVKLDGRTIFEGQNLVSSGCVITNSCVGYASYVARNTILDQTKIGKFSTIGPDVEVVRGQHPTRKFVSIHPAFYSPDHEGTNIHFCREPLFDEYRFTKNGYAVEIGNDVWIGQGVRIMEGVTIGDGAIVASGGVVVKDVPSFTIVGGVPTKLLRDRFQEKEKEFLKRLKWWDKSMEWLQEHSIYFHDIELLMQHVNSEEL